MLIFKIYIGTAIWHHRNTILIDKKSFYHPIFGARRLYYPSVGALVPMPLVKKQQEKSNLFTDAGFCPDCHSGRMRNPSIGNTHYVSLRDPDICRPKKCEHGAWVQILNMPYKLKSGFSAPGRRWSNYDSVVIFNIYVKAGQLVSDLPGYCVVPIDAIVRYQGLSNE